MTDIRQWLEELGLDQYTETFEHNEMDIDLVRDLGKEELEKLGVSVMGHRVKMCARLRRCPPVTAKSRLLSMSGKKRAPRTSTLHWTPNGANSL